MLPVVLKIKFPSQEKQRKSKK